MNEERIKAVAMLMSLLTSDEKEAVIRNVYQDMSEEFVFAHANKDEKAIHVMGHSSEMFLGNLIISVVDKEESLKELLKCVLK